jgi:hypothetical protein
MSKIAGPSTQQAAAPAPPPPPAYGAAAMVDLVDKINWSSCEALNTTKKDALGSAVKQGLRDQEAMLMESDADEQLLLTIAFSTKVKLHTIHLAGPSDGRAPKTVKIFANRSGLSFDDAESANAEQEIEFTPEMLGTRVELKFVKFQSVDSVTIFVGSNQGDEESTAISCVKFWGCEIQGTKMDDFKRVAGEKGEGE